MGIKLLAWKVYDSISFFFLSEAEQLGLKWVCVDGWVGGLGGGDSKLRENLKLIIYCILPFQLK